LQNYVYFAVLFYLNDQRLLYDGYTLQWADDFNGSELNRGDWNIELHAPGWVNNELQAYVDSPENIYLENGSLVIKPIEQKNPDGTVSYTSGRVNTQTSMISSTVSLKHGLRCLKAKGFLPAFWMMPNNAICTGSGPDVARLTIRGRY